LFSVSLFFFVSFRHTFYDYVYFCSYPKLQHTSLQMATAVDAETKTALATAANEARGLAMDSIAAAHSGHMGLPLGAAEIGAVLYGSQVSKYSVRILCCLREAIFKRKC
jgi:hypothetical protein